MEEELQNFIKKYEEGCRTGYPMNLIFSKSFIITLPFELLKDALLTPYTISPNETYLLDGLITRYTFLKRGSTAKNNFKELFKLIQWHNISDDYYADIVQPLFLFPEEESFKIEDCVFDRIINPDLYTIIVRNYYYPLRNGVEQETKIEEYLDQLFAFEITQKDDIIALLDTILKSFNEEPINILRFIRLNGVETCYSLLSYKNDDITIKVLNLIGEVARSDFYYIFPAFDIFNVINKQFLFTKDGLLLTNIIAILFVSLMHKVGLHYYRDKNNLEYFLSIYQYTYPPLLYYVSELLKIAIVEENWPLIKESCRHQFVLSVFLVSPCKTVKEDAFNMIYESTVKEHEIDAFVNPDTIYSLLIFIKDHTEDKEKLIEILYQLVSSSPKCVKFMLEHGMTSYLRSIYKYNNSIMSLYKQMILNKEILESFEKN